MRSSGRERVYEGGLKVYTTMDPDLQRAAEAEVARALDEDRARQARARRSSGRVGREACRRHSSRSTRKPEKCEQWSAAEASMRAHSTVSTQSRRQAGSAFKPFVYAAALERGYTPASLDHEG